MPTAFSLQEILKLLLTRSCVQIPAYKVQAMLTNIFPDNNFIYNEKCNWI